MAIVFASIENALEIIPLKDLDASGTKMNVRIFRSISVLAVLAIVLYLSVCVESSPQKGARLGVFAPDGRIINGTLASQNATKHQVSLRRRLNDGYYFGTGHICGGSLIAPNVVLTAAHCFMDQYINDGTLQSSDDFIVVMGNLDRFEDDNNTLTFDIGRIAYALTTEKFNKSTYEKDIALLFLNGSVPIHHPTIQPISINRQPIANGTVCQVTGWGITEDENISEFLMTVDVPVLSSQFCANESDFDSELIRQGMMCAGYVFQGERDACNGDSGGPLVCHGHQAGIVSWGIDCAKPHLPGIYTDVAFYAPWIDETLRMSNITLPGAGTSLNSKVNFVFIGCLVVFTFIFGERM